MTRPYRQVAGEPMPDFNPDLPAPPKQGQEADLHDHLWFDICYPECAAYVAPKQVGGDQEARSKGVADEGGGGVESSPHPVPAALVNDRATSVGGEDTHLDPDTAPRSEQSDSGPKLGEDTQARCQCCGDECEPRDPDPWQGRLDGYCEDCAHARCDAYPGDCEKPRQNRATPDPPSPDGERTGLDDWAAQEIKDLAAALEREQEARHEAERELERSRNMRKAADEDALDFERRMDAAYTDRDLHEREKHQALARAEKAEAERDEAKEAYGSTHAEWRTASTEIERLRRGVEQLAEALRSEARIPRAKRGKAQAYDEGWSHAFDEIATRLYALLDPAPPEPTPSEEGER